jgi:hypothetical protein
MSITFRFRKRYGNNKYGAAVTAPVQLGGLRQVLYNFPPAQLANAISPILFQGDYLTIKRQLPLDMGFGCEFGFPNMEV